MSVGSLWVATVCSQISTRSQTDTKSTLTDTRSNSRETDSRKRTDICQATPTDRSPSVSLTTPAAKGSSAPAPSSLPPPSGAPPAPSLACLWCSRSALRLECSSCTRVSPTYCEWRQRCRAIARTTVMVLGPHAWGALAGSGVRPSCARTVPCTCVRTLRTVLEV